MGIFTLFHIQPTMERFSNLLQDLTTGSSNNDVMSDTPADFSLLPYSLTPESEDSKRAHSTWLSVSVICILFLAVSWKKVPGTPITRNQRHMFFSLLAVGVGGYGFE